MIKAVTIGAVHTHTHTHTHNLSNNIKKILIVIFKQFKLQKNKKVKKFNKKYFEKIKYKINNKGHPLII